MTQRHYLDLYLKGCLDRLNITFYLLNKLKQSVIMEDSSLKQNKVFTQKTKMIFVQWILFDPKSRISNSSCLIIVEKPLILT